MTPAKPSGRRMYTYEMPHAGTIMATITAKPTAKCVPVLVLPWSKEAKEAMAHQMAVAIGKTPCGVCPAPVPLGYFEECGKSALAVLARRGKR